MNVIEGTGAIVVEPDWESLFSDVLEIAAAKEHWRIVTTELKDRQLLAAANGHSIQRLVCAYLMFDRMYREVAESGVVSKPRRGNSKAIARVRTSTTSGSSPSMRPRSATSSTPAPGSTSMSGNSRDRMNRPAKG